MLEEIDATLIGDVVALFDEKGAGGSVFINGFKSFQWSAGRDDVRRMAAVQLVEIGAGTARDVAAGFGITTECLRLWRRMFSADGVAALAPGRRGPKRPSLLTEAKAAQIRTQRTTGASLRATAEATGVSTDTVRRALAAEPTSAASPAAAVSASLEDAPSPHELPVPPVPVPVPVPHSAERAAAGVAGAAPPVFAPAARVPYVGLFLAFPALERAGLLTCAKDVYGSVPEGFYGLGTILVDSVLRALAGESRAEGASRFTPEDLGRVLGMDRAPEVKTIRRRIAELAETGKAQELITALATRHLRTSGPSGEDLAAVLYVDGHVRAYQGTKKIGKLYSTRLKFPVPATEETWVTDANGAPVFLVMAAPGASLAGELRALLPQLRGIIGDDRRVLVGFDRGGWSPALFKHMAEQGFDVLTWRKRTTDDVPEDQFTQVTCVDDHGEIRSWNAADTLIGLPLPTTKKTGEVLHIRQITRIVPATGGGTRQIHILTTDRKLPAGEAIYKMGNRWRQENQFRYARMHFELDSHDSYATSDDDPDRLVPNPAKAKAYQKVLAARKNHAEVAAQTEAALMGVRTPPPGQKELKVILTNKMHNQITAPLWKAEKALKTAETAHKKIPARLRLGKLAPGQQVLDTEVKLIHHGIRMAAYNTAMTIAREIRTNTGYKRANHEAHTLMRQAFNQSGDINPTEPGYLTIRLDPLPTQAKTAAIAELCEHLTTTQTRYPGTELILRYEIKKRN